MTIEEMDREVEEARQAILDHTNDRWAVLEPRLRRLIAAVEKRERARFEQPPVGPVIDLAVLEANWERWMAEGCAEHGPMGHHIDFHDDNENRRCACGRNLGRARSSEEAGAEIHHDRLRWNFHPFQGGQR